MDINANGMWRLLGISGTGIIMCSCQIHTRRTEIQQKTSRNISRYFCSSFQGHSLQNLKYANTGKMQCKMFHLCPRCGFLSHMKNFTAIPKFLKHDNYSKCKHFNNSKNFTPEFVPPPPKKITLQKLSIEYALRFDSLRWLISIQSY